MADTPIGGAAVKRIELKVSSASPNLQGLTQTINSLERLNTVLRRVNQQAGILSRTTGLDLSSMGRGVEQAAARIHSAMGNIAADAKRAGREIQGALASYSKTELTDPGKKVISRTTSQTSKVGATTNIHRQIEGLDDAGNLVTTGYRNTTTTNLERAAQQAQKVREKAFRDAKAQEIRAERAKSQELFADAQRSQSIKEQREKLWQSQEAKNRAEQIRNSNRTAMEVGRHESDLLKERELRMQEGVAAARRVRDANDREEQRARQRRFSELRRERERFQMPTRAEEMVRMREAGLMPPSAGGGGGGRPGWYSRGLRGFTPGGFAHNMVTGGGWMAAMGAVFAGANLVRYSYSRIENIQLQTARLQQVFQKVGGSAQQLTDDVLKLAAAEGRSTDEAVQSAIAWSRLGLTRQQVNSAVRVSLMAANVAEMTAAETTQHFAAIMAGFNLEVSQLDGVLGMLNQTSNTYRVTVADLLQGVSRVAGVAQQAGISLAELQGILGATVQKTGQSGANIANALKTTLVRLNRSDVREFFAQRYNFQPTGSAEDLQKLYEIYSRVNDEQRRDILLKVGSATQASRLASILQSYPESLKAAINSLENLNSAEKENVLITNTAAAARARLQSSWDRAVSRPGLGNIGASIFNNAASGVAGLTPGARESKGSQLYFNPDRVEAGQGIANILNIPTFGLVHLATNWTRTLFDSLTSGFSKWDWAGAEKKWKEGSGFFTTPQSLNDVFSLESKFINQRQGWSDASALKSRALEMLARTYGSSKNKGDLLQTLGGFASPEAVEKLKRGDASMVLGESAGYKVQGQQEFDRAQRLRQRSVDRLKEMEATAEQRKDFNEMAKLAEDRRAREREMAEYAVERARALREELSEHQAIVQALTIQRELSQGIASAFKGLSLSDYNSKLLTLGAELAAINAQVNQAVHRAGTPDAVLQKLKEEQFDIGQKYAAHRSPAGYALARFGQNVGLADRFASMDVAGAGVGRSEGEKLLNQRDYIERQLRDIGSQRNISENQRVRALTLISELTKVELGLRERLVANDRERKQLTIETSREFQKSLIGAGPGELLRKLAAFQLNRKGMTSGSFFALSPDAQRDVYSLRGGDRAADLNREASALDKGGVGSLEQIQQVFSMLNAGAMSYAERLGASLPMPQLIQSATVSTDAAASVANHMATAAGHSATVASNMERAANASAGMPPISPSAQVPKQGHGAGGEW